MSLVVVSKVTQAFDGVRVRDGCLAGRASAR